MLDDRGELRPPRDLDPGRGCRDSPLNGWKKATNVDVELVLGSFSGGVDDERHRVAIRRTPSGVGKKRSGAPCSVEIRRGVGQL